MSALGEYTELPILALKADLFPSHNALKRRHEDEDDEDLQDEQEVERLSFYDGKDDSDIENNIEHKTDIPESISVFKKSKGAYKKRKMGPGFRDGSGTFFFRTRQL